MEKSETFVCGVCGYVAFDHAPVDCPVCNSPIENFNRDPEAIMRPEDPDNPDDLEKMHTPLVTLSRECGISHGSGCIAVGVRVGEAEHVMESEHYITFLDLYVDKRHLARIHMTYRRLHPSAVMHLNVDRGTLTVIGNCNVHGSWMTEVSLA